MRSLAHSRPSSGSQCIFLQDRVATNLLLCLPPPPRDLHPSSVIGDELTSYPDDCVNWMRTVETQNTLGWEHPDREPVPTPGEWQLSVPIVLEGGAQASHPHDSLFESRCCLSCSSFLGSQAYCVLFKAAIPRAVTSLLFHSWTCLFFKQIFVRLIFLSL